VGRPRLRDEEPFATIRAYPRRFAVGVPVVFVLSLGAGLAAAERSLSGAVALLLLLQTGGLLWLYVPALRRRLREGEGGQGTEQQGEEFRHPED
jgi:hypothetical protein